MTQNKQILLVNIQKDICNCLRASQPECSEVFDINIYEYYPESHTPEQLDLSKFKSISFLIGTATLKQTCSLHSRNLNHEILTLLGVWGGSSLFLVS